MDTEDELRAQMAKALGTAEKDAERRIRDAIENEATRYETILAKASVESNSQIAELREKLFTVT
jgi:polyhydroxyalkanoate synthesis regulator phasin